ncbi:hypothetical protein QL992_16635 [Microbacterium sp. APC 3898]|uniref:DUF3953 domain-containing protein n=1 Tax=Planococcus notacanthi TaxID=3035188 RepID=A0ABT7ZH64_9BACL|nr:MULTISPECIES: hypothetical protein [Terrabacteria group]MDN3426496.1 hypothetical protein [Planococcus sp. APC 4016]MDN3500851.1 hypothetical protein [Microbacterium sp. APC 3898]
MLKKLTIGFALAVLILSIFELVDDSLELSSHTIFLMMSGAFLLFGIEKVKEGMKRTGALYLLVFLLSFMAAVSSF